MRIIDITGPIQNGMWQMPEPFPQFEMTPLQQPEWVTHPVWCDCFAGMHSQTGTYLETPAHFLGPEASYLLSDVPLEALYERRCVVLQLPQANPGSRLAVSAALLTQAPGSDQIQSGDALLISTGWGKYWMDPCYLDRSPYFTRDAMEWIVSKKPFLLGGDLARWENLDNPQNFFPLFYDSNILMLAPCVGLEQMQSVCAKLTVLPLHIPQTCCAPCRAILCEE